MELVLNCLKDVSFSEKRAVGNFYKIVPFWNIVPISTAPFYECRVQVSGKENFGVLDLNELVEAPSKGLHYFYELDYSEWINQTKFIRVEVKTLDNFGNVTGTYYSNTLKFMLSEPSLTSTQKLLGMLPGYRFYTSDENSVLGKIYTVYAQEFNDLRKDVVANELSVLPGNSNSFYLLDTLNDYDNFRLWQFLVTHKQISNTPLFLEKLSNIITGEKADYKFVRDLPNIIIGDETNVFYVIDRGVPPDFTINPPLRAINYLIWGLNITFHDPKQILKDRLENIKPLFLNMFPVGYFIEFSRMDS